MCLLILLFIQSQRYYPLSFAFSPIPEGPQGSPRIVIGPQSVTNDYHVTPLGLAL